MAHVCLLTQRMDWATGSAPGEVIQWDRKAWSHENHFTAVGVSVDLGNHVLSIIMLAIRHVLGMEPLLEARMLPWPTEAAPRRAVGWPDKDEHKCEKHPLLAGATAAGISRKEGCMKPISDLTKKGTFPEECLRLVLAILAHHGPGQGVTLLQDISTSAQERLGDIIEAAGGVLGPYAPAATSLMATMHEAHGIDQWSDTNALIKLSKIAAGVTELSWLLHDPGSPGDIGVQMFDVIHKLRADAAALEPVNHGDRCWICAELKRIGEDDLVIPADGQQHRRAYKIPTRKRRRRPKHP